MSENQDKKEFLNSLKLYGLPWQLFMGIFVIVILSVAYKDPKGNGTLAVDMAGVLVLCIAIAGIFDEIGERLPIWNSYIGGGLLMVFFGTATLKHFDVIPERYSKAINTFISSGSGPNFLTFFIIFLIVGSILSLNRQILVKSFVGYIPAILGGVAVAFVFGIATGMFFGIDPVDISLNYVLPIMGGGNGGGAVPLSQIFAKTTGREAREYYGFAIIILTIANVMCIFAAALLNKLGNAVPALTGDKKTLIRGTEDNLKTNDVKVTYNIKDLGGAMFLALGCYAFGGMFSKMILPTIFGAAIHELAYMIIFVVILAAFGLVPPNICAAAKRLQSFMVGTGAIIIMVGMGVDFNLMDLVSAGSVANLVTALMIVIGAILGSSIVGYMVGFYPIDSAITAGLCMANRGGNGDIAVLGAANRMEMMAYAQLSSRLGGGIVLVIASFLFSFLL